jgi:LuxR family maltose regulon positive regulatory protein
LHQAAAACREAIADLSGPSGELPPIAADVCSRLGDLYYEWNELETALRHLERGVELGRANHNAGLLASNYLSLARGRRAHGDVAQADEALRAATDLCRERGIHPRIVNLVTARTGLLTVARRDTAAAEEWMAARDLSAEDEPTYAHLETYVTLAQVLIFLDRAHQALNLLTRLRLMSEEAGCTGDLIGIQACRALALHDIGRRDAAVSALAHAVRQAEPEGYVRTFVDRGAPIAELLRQVALGGTHPNYVGKLLKAFEDTPPVPVPAEKDPANQALIEPLTDRELEVLNLIAAGLSNAQIAEQLYVAVSTVKKHINHLYGKLEVHRRTQAVARARELGLL